MGRSEYKVPGGKLLRAKAEAEAGKIKFLQVSGDFFMSPETDLEELEDPLLVDSFNRSIYGHLYIRLSNIYKGE